MSKRFLGDIKLQSARTNRPPHLLEVRLRVVSARYPFHGDMVEVSSFSGHGIYGPFLRRGLTDDTRAKEGDRSHIVVKRQ